MREVYALGSETSLPEGLAFDPGSDTFFATAVRGGTITRVTPLGQELVFYRASDPGVSLLGAHVDAARGVLWVCEVDLRAMAAPRSRVLGLRIEDGSLLEAIALPGPAYCNDLTSDEAGTVYVTDSVQPRIFGVAEGEATVFASDPRFAGSPGRLGLSGIDVAPDGESLLVARMSPPGLFRVALADAAVAEVEFFGDAFGMPGDPRFPGPDGLAFVGEELYVAFDGGVQQLRFPVKTRAEVRTTTAVPPGVSSLTEAGGQLYALDGDAYRAMYGGQQADPPFLILRVDTGLFDEP
ncbi:MAG TPA: hypothetical protein VIK91_14530 [Nannocystis sp.]